MKVMKHYGTKKNEENDAKEQISLTPGTDAYDSYEAGLQLHNPFAPDDSFHEELESANAEHAKMMDEKRLKSKNRSLTSQQQYRHRMAKEDMFREVKDTAMDMALKTETKEDDKVAAGINRKGLEGLVLDEGVTEDEYLPKALSKYMD